MTLTRQLRVIGWVAAAVVLIYLLGYIAATLVFMFSFILLEGDLPVRKNALLAVVATILIYVVFVELLSFRLYEGVFGPSLPLF